MQIWFQAWQLFFWNFDLKIPKWESFGPEFKHFSFITKFCKYKNLRVLISNMTNVLKFLTQNYPSKAHFVPNLDIFVLSQNIAHISKCDKSFKFKSKNTQIRSFWFQIKTALFFRKILLIHKFEGADLKYEKMFLKILAKKISK